MRTYPSSGQIDDSCSYIDRKACICAWQRERSPGCSGRPLFWLQTSTRLRASRFSISTVGLPSSLSENDQNPFDCQGVSATSLFVRLHFLKCDILRSDRTAIDTKLDKQSSYAGNVRSHFAYSVTFLLDIQSSFAYDRLRGDNNADARETASNRSQYS
jgi:hypothetical protein